MAYNEIIMEWKWIVFYIDFRYLKMFLRIWDRRKINALMDKNRHWLLEVVHAFYSNLTYIIISLGCVMYTVVVPVSFPFKTESFSFKTRVCGPWRTIFLVEKLTCMTNFYTRPYLSRKNCQILQYTRANIICMGASLKLSKCSNYARLWPNADQWGLLEKNRFFEF